MLVNTLVISAVSIQLEILSQYQWLTSLFCVSNNFLPSIVIVGTIVPTHSIVHTNSYDICGIWLQSSDAVCVSVGDPSLIVLMVAWWIIWITILNIVVVIRSSYSCRRGPLDGDTGVGSINHRQITDCSWRFCNKQFCVMNKGKLWSILVLCLSMKQWILHSQVEKLCVTFLTVFAILHQAMQTSFMTIHIWRDVSAVYWGKWTKLQ